MDCSGFENRLEMLQRGLLTPAERREAEKHLETCPSCRDLANVACGDLPIPPLPLPQDLTRSILERTSGPACGRAHEHLCDFVDGILASNYAEILSLHLAGCAECSELAEALMELKATLPQMGELDPGIGFTLRVLRATSRKQMEFRASRWLRVQQWWLRLIQRPRFSWEAAYLGTILLVCVLGNPLTSVQDLSFRVGASLKSGAPFSLPSVALPGSLVRGESGILKHAKEFAGTLADRQDAWAKSAEGVLGQGAQSLQATFKTDFQSLRSLPSRTGSALKRAWARFFPRPAKSGTQGRS